MTRHTRWCGASTTCCHSFRNNRENIAAISCTKDVPPSGQMAVEGVLVPSGDLGGLSPRVRCWRWRILVKVCCECSLNVSLIVAT